MLLLQTLWRTAPLVHPETTWADSWSRAKYFIRGAITPRLTAEWFGLLAAPSLQPLVRRYPYVLSRLQRPCVHRRLSVRDRLELLITHYEFIGRLAGEDFLERVLAPAGCLLAFLPVPEPKRFSLRLFYCPHSKEGELSLGLYDHQIQQFLFTLAFCATRRAPGTPFEFFIGGLQGSKIPNHRELIIHLTRALHGLRPKALLVFTLRELARIWGIHTIRAVGGREHIYCHYRKRKTFHANYDEFWTECHGTRQSDGNFELPVAAPVRDPAELPRAKRPMYRRRYEMLEAIGDEIAAHLPSAPKEIPLSLTRRPAPGMPAGVATAKPSPMAA